MTLNIFSILVINSLYITEPLIKIKELLLISIVDY
jgi:hypothetical protein